MRLIKKLWLMGDTKRSPKTSAKFALGMAGFFVLLAILVAAGVIEAQSQALNIKLPLVFTNAGATPIDRWVGVEVPTDRLEAVGYINAQQRLRILNNRTDKQEAFIGTTTAAGTGDWLVNASVDASSAVSYTAEWGAGFDDDQRFPLIADRTAGGLIAPSSVLRTGGYDSTTGLNVTFNAHILDPETTLGTLASQGAAWSVKLSGGSDIFNGFDLPSGYTAFSSFQNNQTTGIYSAVSFTPQNSGTITDWGGYWGTVQLPSSEQIYVAIVLSGIEPTTSDWQLCQQSTIQVFSVPTTNAALLCKLPSPVNVVGGITYDVWGLEWNGLYAYSYFPPTFTQVVAGEGVYEIKVETPPSASPAGVNPTVKLMTGGAAHTKTPTLRPVRVGFTAAPSLTAQASTGPSISTTPIIDEHTLRFRVVPPQPPQITTPLIRLEQQRANGTWELLAESTNPNITLIAVPTTPVTLFAGAAGSTGWIDNITMGASVGAPDLNLQFRARDVDIALSGGEFRGVVDNLGTTGGTATWAITPPANPADLAISHGRLELPLFFDLGPDGAVAGPSRGEVADILGSTLDLPDNSDRTEPSADTFGVRRALNEAAVESGNPTMYWVILATVIALFLAGGFSAWYSNLWITAALGFLVYFVAMITSTHVEWYVPAWFAIWGVAVAGLVTIRQRR